jgi:hypothetical protein
MNVPPVGNPLLYAATLAAQKRKESETAESPEPAPDPAQAAEAQEAPDPMKQDLERLADDVLAVFEDSPDRLEQLVATLKRLDAANGPNS